MDAATGMADEGIDGGKAPRGRAVKSFLSGDRTPMWFTIAALLAGAGGTYFIAPAVNAQFEAQKIKTDFVIRNYQDLRVKMEEFASVFVVASQKQAGGEPMLQEALKLQEMVARIGQQNLSMMPMFTSSEGPKAAGEVTTAMNGMVMFLFNNAGKPVETPEQIAAYNTGVADAMGKLTPALLELYVRIGEIGNLDPTGTDVDLKPKGG